MCSVVGCESWRRRAQHFILPADPERRLEWVQFLFEVNGQRLKETSWTDIRVCSEHFTSHCFLTVTRAAGSTQLKSDAVPSVCSPDEPESKQVRFHEVKHLKKFVLYSVFFFSVIVYVILLLVRWMHSECIYIAFLRNTRPKNMVNIRTIPDRHKSAKVNTVYCMLVRTNAAGILAYPTV